MTPVETMVRAAPDAEFRCLKVRTYISATPGCPFSFPLSSSHHRPQLVPGVSSRFRFSESGFAYLGTSIFTHTETTQSLHYVGKSLRWVSFAVAIVAGRFFRVCTFL